ncbi:transcriptional regulator [Thermanaeromonas sp. C210]|nr:autorepressor SdpR family transcription factor [Thermanaeromonas sp. C210]GFN22144.1 transcriptional regulator [Thermanaeromonas sp. C210]
MGLNDIFRALGDPTRREIMRLLGQKDMTAGEIADHFRLTKATISHHLGVLKDAGLVLSERRGQYMVYSLNATVFQHLLAWLLELTGRDQEGGNRAPKQSGREVPFDG